MKTDVATEARGPRYERPRLSRVYEKLPVYGVDLFVGGQDGASDLALLRANGISTVVNCAVNLDFNYVEGLAEPDSPAVRHGAGAIRYYKLGIVDGPGNPETMMLAGYYLLRGALEQILPVKPSYPFRERGNVLINCRAGRSRSVILVALFLHVHVPERFPTLEAAIDHVRERRELHPDEWFETPKPMLVAAARRTRDWIAMIEKDIAERPVEAVPGADA
jgi:hypothetical protein